MFLKDDTSSGRKLLQKEMTQSKPVALFVRLKQKVVAGQLRQVQCQIDCEWGVY